MNKRRNTGGKKFFVCSLVAVAAFFCSPDASAAPELPKDTFEWVQSTSMSGYYFNKEQICYGADANGYIDRNVLIVPTIKIYSAKQIEDVVQKRRWRMEDLSGYGDLVGAADYLSIDVAAKTVTVTEHDELDKNWWPLTKITEPRTIKLDDLSDKDVNGNFYRRILEWAAAHDNEILAHSLKKGLKVNPKDAAEKSDESDKEKHKHKNK